MALLQQKQCAQHARGAGAHSGKEDGTETVSSQPQQGFVFCICGHSGLVLPVGRLLSCVPHRTSLYIVHLAVSLLHSAQEHVINESGLVQKPGSLQDGVTHAPGFHLEQSIAAHLQHRGADCAEKG